MHREIYYDSVGMCGWDLQDKVRKKRLTQAQIKFELGLRNIHFILENGNILFKGKLLEAYHMKVF